MENKTYVISVKVYKGCYRHIKIGGQETLNDLACAILNSFDFDFDHLSTFYMNNKLYDYDDSYGVELFPGMPNDDRYQAKDYTLNELDLYPKKKFIYLFDFGDNWKFDCTVLRVLDEYTKSYEVIRSKGENPEQYPEYDGEW